MTLPASARVVTFLGTRNRAAAKAFYCDVLGVKYVSEDPFALVLETDGKAMRISELKDSSRGASPRSAGWWRILRLRFAR